MSPSHRSILSISLPAAPDFALANYDMPKTPERRDEAPLVAEPPPPPRPQAFKVRRRRTIVPSTETMMLDIPAIPTIEMSEAPVEISSPILRSMPSRDLLSPLPTSAVSRGWTPPKTPAPRTQHTIFSKLESPVQEWDLITHHKPAYQRANSVYSTFSDSSISSCGSSSFSLPTGGYDSPASEAADPFVDDETTQNRKPAQHQPTNISGPATSSPTPKRMKTRRHIKWTPEMDHHLWMTFMSYLSDPTMTPFKMLPGSTPPMGVCDQVATKARKTWRACKGVAVVSTSIDAMIGLGGEMQQQTREGSPDTIRTSSLQAAQQKWPKDAPTRKRLRELCTRRPSISAHYQRMLRTRSPSPFDTSSPATATANPPPAQPPRASSAFSAQDMRVSLLTSTAPSMQPEGPLAQLHRDNADHQRRQSERSARPADWFARVPRSKAHQKSASLQTITSMHDDPIASSSTTTPLPPALASPFDVDPTCNRSQLLESMSNTKSLGRTVFNGKSLDSPVEFKLGAPTDRRSRKRRFRSDEEKPRRPALEDVFGPPTDMEAGRNRGFSLGAVHATDNLKRLFMPPPLPFDSSSQDHDMLDEDAVIPSSSSHAMTPIAPPLFSQDTPMGYHSAPRRLAEPIPRLGSPFMETPPPTAATPLAPRRQHNTFPRATLIPTLANQHPFHQRLQELAAERSAPGADNADPTNPFASSSAL